MNGVDKDEAKMEGVAEDWHICGYKIEVSERGQGSVGLTERRVEGENTGVILLLYDTFH